MPESARRTATAPPTACWLRSRVARGRRAPEDAPRGGAPGRSSRDVGSGCATGRAAAPMVPSRRGGARWIRSVWSRPAAAGTSWPPATARSAPTGSPVWRTVEEVDEPAHRGPDDGSGRGLAAAVVPRSRAVLPDGSTATVRVRDRRVVPNSGRPRASRSPAEAARRPRTTLRVEVAVRRRSTTPSAWCGSLGDGRRGAGLGAAAGGAGGPCRGGRGARPLIGESRRRRVRITRQHIPTSVPVRQDVWTRGEAPSRGPGRIRVGVGEHPDGRSRVRGGRLERHGPVHRHPRRHHRPSTRSSTGRPSPPARPPTPSPPQARPPSASPPPIASPPPARPSDALRAVAPAPISQFTAATQPDRPHARRRLRRAWPRASAPTPRSCACSLVALTLITGGAAAIVYAAAWALAPQDERPAY